LATQILLLQLAIIVVTVGVGVAVLEARRALDQAAGRRSLVIARTELGPYRSITLPASTVATIWATRTDVMHAA
jgi:hypothetical protein